jgi:tetratricopeptide (TPR) repeat protein
VAESAKDRLVSVIQDSDLVLAEDGDSEDPVAARRVAEALARKATALRRLERFEESVTVWDELVVRYRNEPLAAAPLIAVNASLQKAQDLARLRRHREALHAVEELFELCDGQDETAKMQLFIARALGVKVRALELVGSTDESIRCAEEMVARFAQAEDPELRQWVAWALHQQTRALIHNERIDDALVVSERLVSRVPGESAESLPGIAEIINGHIMLLLGSGGGGLSGVAQFVLGVLVNAAGEALKAAGSVLLRDQRLPSPRRPRALRLLSIGQSARGLVVSAGLVQRRGRARQALHAARTLIARIGTSDDPDLRPLAVTAEFTTGTALFFLGHLRAGLRVMAEVTDRDDADAIQALQRLGELFAQGQSVLNQLGTVGVLSLRADMLGAGDPEVAKIAYDDSVAAHQATSTYARITRLSVKSFRPRVKRTSRPRNPADPDPRANGPTR